MSAPHVSVLLNEVVGALEPAPGKLIVDGTFGAGGYTRALLAAGAERVSSEDSSALAFSSASFLKQLQRPSEERAPFEGPLP